MLKFKIGPESPVILGVLISVLPVASLANNGMYVTGYGNESVLMGGADVAVARDAFAATNNPSGMTQISGQSAEGSLSYYNNKENSHTDSFGNYRKPVKDSDGVYGSAAYARRFESSPYVAGVALIVQGGMGWRYSGLNTNPDLGGMRDDASSLFAIVKLSPAIAWEVNDQLSVGMSVGFNYMAANQELFPNTSVAPNPSNASVPDGFFGFRFKNASGTGWNSKWGLQYRPMKDVTIGLAYGTRASVPLKNGSLRINMSSVGLGVVRYDDAQLTGFHMPEELALGISFRPTPRLLISLQDKWYNWSEAIKDLELSADSPRTPGAQPLVIHSSPRFTDQHVIEIGLAYDYDAKTVLMGGINHGSRPIPDDSDSLGPIFKPIQARHYMFGAKRQLDKEWNLAGGVELYTAQSVTYDSPIFGPRANELHYALVYHVSLGRRW